MTLPALQPGDIVEPDLKLVEDGDYQDLEVIDGYLVAPDGEIVGLAERPGEFHVADQASAEWVLDKMAKHDAEIAALEMRLKALQQNLQRMQGQEIRGRSFLEYRFGGELIEFARRNLKGRCKTWTCAYGSVAFKKQPRGVEVLDEEAAIKWAKVVCPAAVQVKEKLLISLCKEMVLADPPATEHGFNIFTPTEKATIKTGVAKQNLNLAPWEDKGED
jgi:hypothetical protein